MKSVVIILVIISALFHALRNFLTKKSNDKQLFVWHYELIGVILLSPLFFYILLKQGIGNWKGILFGILSGSIHALYWISHSKSYEKDDLSQAYPIMRSAPIFILILAIIFLNEKTSIISVLGIFIAVGGVFTISFKNKIRPSYYVILTLFLIIIYSIIDKIGVSYTSPILFSFFFTFFGSLFLSVYIIFTKNKFKIENKKRAICAGIFATGGYTLILIALSLEKVSYIVGLRQISIVFATLLGGFILKEKNKKSRIFGSSLVFLGAIFISLG